MNYLSATSTQLLDSLKDESNQEVWRSFDARYRPIIEGVARRLGLPVEDAADVAQETLVSFVRDYRRGQYRRGQGRLRTWIMAIARNRAIDVLRARGRSPGVPGDSAFAAIASEKAVEDAWEVEEEREILKTAYQELMSTTKADPATQRLFELTAIQGRSPDAAAQECGTTGAQARLAKHRMMKQLKEIVDRLTQSYIVDE